MNLNRRLELLLQQTHIINRATLDNNKMRRSATRNVQRGAAVFAKVRGRIGARAALCGEGFRGAGG